MDREWQTAEDLAKEMAADPIVSRRLKERSDRHAKRSLESRKALEPVVSAARRLGFHGETIEAILKHNVPMPSLLAELFLSSLFLEGLRPREQESIVRALGAAEHPFDASGLFKLFESTSDESLKWAIVNTLAMTKPRGIEEWLTRIRGTHWEKTFADLS